MEVSGNKKLIRVIVDMRPNMQIMPVAVFDDSGKRIKVDVVSDIRRVLVKDLGEQCFAYFLVAGGSRKVIYLDKNMQWFEL